jgi:hypothetical protein
MTTQNIYDLADTWNDGATTFTGIGLDVTDTASASDSLLMDLQVGGTSQFKVSKDGRLNLHSGVDADRPSIQFGFAGYGLSMDSNGWLTSVINSAVFASFGQSIVVGSSGSFDFGSGVTTTNQFTRDLSLFRDAADTLAQRRSTNPQAFRVYNSHTDGSNYERGFVAWDTNVLKIGTQAAGTGSARALELQTGGVTRLTIAETGNATFANSLVLGSTNALFWNGRIQLTTSAAGVIRLANATNTDFDRLQFGGATSSFPALKRSATSLQARLADDSAFTNVQGKITTETAYTAGAPTATGYIVLYDSTGTAYKIPAEAL